MSPRLRSEPSRAPQQANAITVGAFTDKFVITDSDI
jgi:hypothetical protein